MFRTVTRVYSSEQHRHPAARTLDTMTKDVPAPVLTAVAVSTFATCPLCHTAEPTLSVSALDAGGDWTCKVCGQFWDAERLHTAAAYRALALTLGTAKPWSVDVSKPAAR
jgi:hypothetical protein